MLKTTSPFSLEKENELRCHMHAVHTESSLKCTKTQRILLQMSAPCLQHPELTGKFEPDLNLDHCQLIYPNKGSSQKRHYYYYYDKRRRMVSTQPCSHNPSRLGDSLLHHLISFNPQQLMSLTGNV